jgi:hypothetical protein
LTGGLERLTRHDVHPVEGVAVALDGPLRIGAVGRVVVDEPRDVGEEISNLKAEGRRQKTQGTRQKAEAAIAE